MGDPNSKLYYPAPNIPEPTTPVNPQFNTVRLQEAVTPTTSRQGTYNQDGNKTYNQGFWYTNSHGKSAWHQGAQPLPDYSKANVAPAVLPFAEYAAMLLNPTHFKNYGRS